MFNLDLLTCNKTLIEIDDSRLCCLGDLRY